MLGLAASCPPANSPESHTLLSRSYAGLECGKCKRRNESVFRLLKWHVYVFVSTTISWSIIIDESHRQVEASLTITSLSSLISAMKKYWGNCMEILPPSIRTWACDDQSSQMPVNKMNCSSFLSVCSSQLTLNLEPVIVRSSHSWPTVNLLNQVQLGIVWVQVKLFPSWTTSVTTLWSVLALRSPVPKSKYPNTLDNVSQNHLVILMVKRNKLRYQSLQEIPHNSLDFPAHISQKKTWCAVQEKV